MDGEGVLMLIPGRNLGTGSDHFPCDFSSTMKAQEDHGSQPPFVIIIIIVISERIMKGPERQSIDVLPLQMEILYYF